MTSTIVLAAKNIVKRFGDVAVLKNVSFDLRAGEVHALCGENGAGKSTLIKLLAGVYPYGSYEGEIFLDGEPVHFSGPRDAESTGIAVIHQELALFSEMSVAENLLLGVLPQTFGKIDWDRTYLKAKEVLGACNINLDPAVKVGRLGVAQRQLVEIARAVARHPRVLVLDEPTAALAHHEIDVLLALVRDLRAKGVSCIYISHKLDEVFRVADRITVLRDGAAVETVDASQTSAEGIIRSMVGRKIEDMYPRRISKRGKALLEVCDLDVAPRNSDRAFLRNINFTVHAGEVLGIGGLMGAGRTELLMHLFGLWGRKLGGKIRVDGKDFGAPSPARALCRGLALVTEDRKRFGLVLEQGVSFNLSLSNLNLFSRFFLIDREAEAMKVRSSIKDLNIKTHALDAAVAKLSGGNQQKVVIGKVLMTGPSVLLLDEPTRGIDVGAKVEVYELVNRLTEQGKGIILVSSELGELIGLSDRIIMLHEGRIGGEFLRGEATQEKLLAAAMGRSMTEAA
jgi:D-xylose transport system ATP-binding protein